MEMPFKKNEVIVAEEFEKLYHAPLICPRCKKHKSILYLHFDTYLCIDCLNEVESLGDNYVV